MKKIYNNIIPFKGFKAMTVWPLLFIRNGAKDRFDETDECHEKIHGQQQEELLFAGALIAAVLFVVGCGWWSLLSLPLAFYLYGLFYLIGLLRYRNHKKAYRNNPFEVEAFLYERDAEYLSQRKHFAWCKYIFKHLKTIDYEREDFL